MTRRWRRKRIAILHHRADGALRQFPNQSVDIQRIAIRSFQPCSCMRRMGIRSCCTEVRRIGIAINKHYFRPHLCITAPISKTLTECCCFLYLLEQSWSIRGDHLHSLQLEKGIVVSTTFPEKLGALHMQLSTTWVVPQGRLQVIYGCFIVFVLFQELSSQAE